MAYSKIYLCVSKCPADAVVSGEVNVFISLVYMKGSCGHCHSHHYPSLHFKAFYFRRHSRIPKAYHLQLQWPPTLLDIAPMFQGQITLKLLLSVNRHFSAFKRHHRQASNTRWPMAFWATMWVLSTCITHRNYCLGAEPSLHRLYPSPPFMGRPHL